MSVWIFNPGNAGRIYLAYNILFIFHIIISDIGGKLSDIFFIETWVQNYTYLAKFRADFVKSLGSWRYVFCQISENIFKARMNTCTVSDLSWVEMERVARAGKYERRF